MFRLMLRAQLRSRPGRQAALVAALALAFAAFLVGGMALGGAHDAVLRPAHDFLSGDVRVTHGDAELAAGSTWNDTVPVLQALRQAGGVAAPRWEASQVTVRVADLADWTGGLLVGLDTTVPDEQDALAGYLVWGSRLPTASPQDPSSHRSYVPLLVGVGAALRLGVGTEPGTQPDFAKVVRISTGRFTAGPDGPPLASEGVVVGVFRTGLEPLDRFTVYAPVGDVRFLVGGHPGDTSGNAIVLHGTDAPAVRAVLGDPFIVQGAPEFASGYVGLALVLLDAAFGLATAVVLVVLGVLVAREVAGQVARDGPAIAALRAMGWPAGRIAAAHASSAFVALGAAYVLALLFAGAVAALVPGLGLRSGDLTARLAWRLDWVAALWVLAGATSLAAIASWIAFRQVLRGPAAAGLRRD